MCSSCCSSVLYQTLAALNIYVDAQLCYKYPPYGSEPSTLRKLHHKHRKGIQTHTHTHTHTRTHARTHAHSLTHSLGVVYVKICKKKSERRNTFSFRESTWEHKALSVQFLTPISESNEKMNTRSHWELKLERSDCLNRQVRA